MQAVRLPSERWTAGLTGSGHGNLELPSCSQRLWKRMGSRGTAFPSLKGGKCSPHFRVSTAAGLHPLPRLLPGAAFFQVPRWKAEELFSAPYRTIVTPSALIQQIDSMLLAEA